MFLLEASNHCIVGGEFNAVSRLCWQGEKSFDLYQYKELFLGLDTVINIDQGFGFKTKLPGLFDELLDDSLI